jgi:hypothetical protein
MRGTIPPLPQYVFMAWCLVKHRHNFTFLPFIGYVTPNSSVNVNGELRKKKKKKKKKKKV